MSFSHLHNHSEYSLADGLFAPAKWAEVLEQRGFKAHALTDHGTCAGHLPFYQAMRDRKLLPILGCEFYFNDEPTVKTPENRRVAHLILLAKDYESGYRNLLRLQKLSYTDGFYYRPRIGLEWLARHHEGLVCLTACLGGVLSAEVWGEFKQVAAGADHAMVRAFGALEVRYAKLHAIFGADLYVEFQAHDDAERGQQRVQREFYERLRSQSGFQQIVTNDCHYVLPEHARMQAILKEHAYRQKSEAAGASYTTTETLWLRSALEIATAFSRAHDYLPRAFFLEGMKRTEEVVDKCAGFALPTGKRYLPRFKKFGVFASGTTSKEIFRTLVVSKLSEFLRGDPSRLHVDQVAYKTRFATEYQVIAKYDLEDYFLIVWDLVEFARRQGIYVGLGRGSAAGCLISYLLGIVQVDPLEHGLLFERFLNATRCEAGELPDIDLDFESRRRGEIKRYIYETYGVDRVCEIGTYGRIKLKTGILDFGASLKVADRKTLLDITTRLDLDKEVVNSLEEARAVEPKLDALVVAHPYFGFAVREIIGEVRGGPGEGQVKSAGVHPAGMIISDEPVAEITPVKSQVSGETGERILTTQAEDRYLLAQGLVKMDVLGIKEYDIIRYILENAPDKTLTRENYVERIMAEERAYQERGDGTTLSGAVWDYFRAGQTDGVFQFASDVMRALVRDMQPDRLDDLIAAVALVRPGCLKNGWHTQYCNRKHGREAVTFAHPLAEQVLAPTYGVVTFQEQFMSLFHLLGDIPLVQSDVIRSALGKKDPVKLAKFREQFVRGATPKLGSEARAQEVWTQIEKASGYTFNRAHAASYAILAYISQYLKVRYPALFWAAHLDWDAAKNDQEAITAHRRAAAEMGVHVVHPGINSSRAHFAGDVTKMAVRWGFQGIKGVGEGAAEALEAGQPYADLDAFLASPTLKGKVRANHLEALAYAGVFDGWLDRREVLARLYARRKKKGPMFTWSDKNLALGFKNVMGFFQDRLKDRVIGWQPTVVGEAELRRYDDGAECLVGGMVTALRRIKTKNGDPMGFLSLVDKDEQIDVVIFPKTWLKFRAEWVEGKVLEVKGTKNVRNGAQNQVIVDEVRELSW